METQLGKWKKRALITSMMKSVMREEKGRVEGKREANIIRRGLRERWRRPGRWSNNEENIEKDEVIWGKVWQGK